MATKAKEAMEKALNTFLSSVGVTPPTRTGKGSHSTKMQQRNDESFRAFATRESIAKQSRQENRRKSFEQTIRLYILRAESLLTQWIQEWEELYSHCIERGVAFNQARPTLVNAYRAVLANDEGLQKQLTAIKGYNPATETLETTYHRVLGYETSDGKWLDTLSSVNQILNKAGLPELVDATPVLAQESEQPSMTDKGEAINIRLRGSKFIRNQGPTYLKSKWERDAQEQNHKRDIEWGLLGWSNRSNANVEPICGRIVHHTLAATDVREDSILLHKTINRSVSQRLIASDSKRSMSRVTDDGTLMEYEVTIKAGYYLKSSEVVIAYPIDGLTAMIYRKVKRLYLTPDQYSAYQALTDGHSQYLSDNAQVEYRETSKKLMQRNGENVTLPIELHGHVTLGKYGELVPNWSPWHPTQEVPLMPEFDQRIVPSFAAPSKDYRKESIHSKPPVTTVQHSTFPTSPAPRGNKVVGESHQTRLQIGKVVWSADKSPIQPTPATAPLRVLPNFATETINTAFGGGRKASEYKPVFLKAFGRLQAINCA